MNTVIFLNYVNFAQIMHLKGKTVLEHNTNGYLKVRALMS